MKNDIKKQLLDEMKSSLLGKAGGDKLASLKKVTVMSPNEEGLQAGLSKAQQLLRQKLGLKGTPSAVKSEDSAMEEKKPLLESPEDELQEVKEGSEQGSDEEEENHDLPKFWELMKGFSKDEILQTINYLQDMLKQK
jgi:hypothetical protein